jgi:hypothetical protein
LTVYSGTRIPEWRGNGLFGALSGQHLRRLVVETSNRSAF